MAKIQRNLILTIDMQGAQDWQVRAIQAQMADWIKANKAVLSFENLVILPTTGDTRLYWLEGTDDPIDVTILNEIKDRLEPVLQVALNLKLDKEGLFKRPRVREYPSS